MVPHIYWMKLATHSVLRKILSIVVPLPTDKSSPLLTIWPMNLNLRFFVFKSGACFIRNPMTKLIFHSVAMNFFRHFRRRKKEVLSSAETLIRRWILGLGRYLSIQLFPNISSCSMWQNKEDYRLAQLNLALVFGEKSGFPKYYRKLVGNISDVRTVQNLIAEFIVLSFEKVKLFTDRGFYSKGNMNGLLKEHLKFIVTIQTSSSFKHKEIDTFYDNIVDRKLMAMRRKESLNGKLVSEHECFYKKYFQIKETPIRGIQISVKEDAAKKTKS